MQVRHTREYPLRMLAWIAYTPVKGLGLQELPAAELTEHGIAGDRTFYLVNERGHLTNSRRVGALHQVRAAWDPSARVLELAFPDGARVSEAVDWDGQVTTNFYGRPVTGRVVTGAFAEALSEFAGQPLTLVEAVPGGDGIDRGRDGSVSLLSTAALARMAAIAGVAAVDGRRFRMNFGVDGVDAHAEDAWVDQLVRIGAAVIRPRGHVGRCVITARDPDTGEQTLDTLGLLARYRDDIESTERLPFGVYGEVVTPGRLALGDPVEPLG